MGVQEGSHYAPRASACRALALTVGLLLLTGAAGLAQATPIATLPGLVQVTVYERSLAGGPTAFSFAPNSAPILQRLPVVDGVTNDFAGFTTEYYDLYYSDADGTPDPDGMYLTVDGLFGLTSDAGYNIAEVVLDFGVGGTEFASEFTRVNSLGSFALPATAGNAIDGDLDTHTFLGDSTDQDNRLSMTFGFASSVPEPSSVLLIGASLAWVAAGRHRRT
jgi:hypothetical protein